MTMTLALKHSFYRLIDVVLRVPPLFIIDELLRATGPQYRGPLYSLESGFYYPQEDFLDVKPDDLTSNDYSSYPYYYRSLLLSFSKYVLICLGCFVSLWMFLLHRRNLCKVYMHILNVTIVLVSFWCNYILVKSVISLGYGQAPEPTPQWSLLEDILLLRVSHLVKSDSVLYPILSNFVVQCVLNFVFTYANNDKHYFLQTFLPFCFVAPSVLATLPLPASILHRAPLFASLLPVYLVSLKIVLAIVPAMQSFYSAYSRVRHVLTNFGIAILLETEWSRLNVPCALRVFWLLRVGECTASLFFTHIAVQEGNAPLLTLAGQMAKSLLIAGCETLTTVLGMASIVSYICYYIGFFFQWVLMVDDDEERPFAGLSAVLFLILSIQTGLTNLEPEKRFVRLCRNISLIFTALLHFVHNMTNPLLLSLAASHNPSLHRHLRAIAVCIFLITFPSALLVFLWSQHSASTWLFAVSSFSIEVIIKVIVTLMIYSLFLIDAYRSNFWEKLDDYVYYIQAFGHTVEFCFGILLFLNGAWILIFESGGALRPIMMCLHAYFNIWRDARTGWKVFMKRRTAVNKINTLPDASAEQLRALDDVCAICYQEMRCAKVTRCNHFFHGVCLRKWLYVQDRCPLCHEILYKVPSEELAVATNVN